MNLRDYEAIKFLTPFIIPIQRWLYLGISSQDRNRTCIFTSRCGLFIQPHLTICGKVGFKPTRWCCVVALYFRFHTQLNLSVPNCHQGRFLLSFPSVSVPPLSYFDSSVLVALGLNEVTDNQFSTQDRISTCTSIFIMDPMLSFTLLEYMRSGKCFHLPTIPCGDIPVYLGHLTVCEYKYSNNTCTHQVIRTIFLKFLKYHSQFYFWRFLPLCNVFLCFLRPHLYLLI